MKAHFEMLARYSAWANKRLFVAAHAMPDEMYRKDMGAPYESIHRTLNHMFVVDILWMSRFRGSQNPPWALDHVAHDFPKDFRARRRSLDCDIQGFVLSQTEDGLDRQITYTTIYTPERVSQSLSSALAHFFNHQAQYRGQCTMMIAQQDIEAPNLDLIQFQRDVLKAV